MPSAQSKGGIVLCGVSTSSSVGIPLWDVVRRGIPTREEMIVLNRKGILNLVTPVVKVHLASWDWRKEQKVDVPK